MTAHDTITLTTNFSGLSGGSEQVVYSVQASDTLNTIASGIATNINADTHLQTIDVSATSSAGAQLNTSKNFSSSATLAFSTNSANASATDGGNNTVTNTYQVSTNNAPSPTLTYDAMAI